MTVPYIVVVNPSQAHSLSELIARQAGPASSLSGSGGSVRRCIWPAVLRIETGMPWTHFPYCARPAMLPIATRSGRAVTARGLPQVQGGAARAPVMSPKRLAILPDVPTAAELGFPRATVQGWIGLHAPAGTPAAILAAIETAVTKALQNPELRARLATQGADVSAETGAAYGKRVADETARWKQVVEAAGIPPQQ